MKRSLDKDVAGLLFLILQDVCLALILIPNISAVLAVQQGVSGLRAAVGSFTLLAAGLKISHLVNIRDLPEMPMLRRLLLSKLQASTKHIFCVFYFKWTS